MSHELLERLRHENPVPGTMPALPIERVLARLDNEPPRADPALSGSRRARRAIGVLIPVASIAVVAVVVAMALTVGGRGHSPGNGSPPPRPRPIGTASSAPRPRHNIRATPLELFRAGTSSPARVGGQPVEQFPETVIPSTVRELGTFAVAGVGRIQYWVANTRQHGICTALRLSEGDWLGIGLGGRSGRPYTACYPTRRQSGAGALIIDGFDFLQTMVSSSNGQRWYIIYGAVSGAGHQAPVRVLDTVSKRNASLVRDHYFAIALHPVGNDYGDVVHLEAFDAAGQRIATQGKALPGTPK